MYVSTPQSTEGICVGEGVGSSFEYVWCKAHWLGAQIVSHHLLVNDAHSTLLQVFEWIHLEFKGEKQGTQ